MKSRFSRAALLCLLLGACREDGETVELGIDIAAGTCGILNRLAGTSSVAIDILGPARCIKQRTCIVITDATPSFASVMADLRARMQPIVSSRLDGATAVAVTAYQNADCTEFVGCGVGDLDSATASSVQVILQCGDLAECDRTVCSQ